MAVRGRVVDRHFPTALPALHTQVKVGDHTAIEVVNYLSSHDVRGIALTSTDGVARGMALEDTHLPLQVPVGDGLLGRVFNVFGEPIDGRRRLDRIKCLCRGQALWGCQCRLS